MKNDDKVVHPEDGLNLEYWAKRWHITGNQLNEAILNTGSVSPIQLKAYLKKRNGQDALFYGLIKWFKPRKFLFHSS